MLPIIHKISIIELSVKTRQSKILLEILCSTWPPRLVKAKNNKKKLTQQTESCHLGFKSFAKETVTSQRKVVLTISNMQAISTTILTLVTF